MKKHVFFIVFIAILLNLVLFVHQSNISLAEEDIITFADSNLESAVRQEINKPTGNIYRTDVENITDLYASLRDITNLSGIENLTNLTNLYLDGNRISNISYLSEMNNIETLDLDTNQIINLSALSNLVNIKYLNLRNNCISDISALSGLTDLVRLDLSHNDLINISSIINNVNLFELILDDNQLNDISSLSSLSKLDVLTLDGNAITDIGPLGNLTQLHTLCMGYNQITDIGAIHNLTKLVDLYLLPNPVKDFSPVKNIYQQLFSKDFTLNTVATINITGPDNVIIPDSGNATYSYTALVKDIDDVILSFETVTWSLTNPVQGVQIDSTSGVALIYNTAEPGSFDIQATNGSVSETYTVSLNKITNSTITPTEASFDKNISAQDDIEVALSLGGNTLSLIKNGTDALVNGADYTVSGDTVVLKKAYLAGLALGKITLAFHFSAGNDVTIDINILDTTPLIDINSIALTIAHTIELSWNPVIGASYYRVYFSPNPGIDTSYFKEIDSSNNSTSINIGGYNESHSWYVNVIAYDAQMKCIGYSIEKGVFGKTISGTVKLPEGSVAPSGGITVYPFIHIPGVISIGYNIPVIIKEDCSVQEYSIHINSSTYSSCALSFQVPNGYGYVNSCFGSSEPIIDMINEPLVDITNNVTDGIDVTLIPGKNITGTVSLQYGTAPYGGLSVEIETIENFGTTDKPLIYSDSYISTILEGQSSAEFVLTVPDNPEGSGYTILYQTVYDYSNEQILGKGYYSLQGTVAISSGATPVNVRGGDVSGINITILKSKTISGVVSLPEGVAPVDGVLVYIDARLVDAETGDLIYNTPPKTVQIPEGSSSVSYSISVPDNERTKYKISYYAFDRIRYLDRGFYGNNNSTVPNVDQASIIDIADKDITNIDLVLLDVKSYITPITTSFDRSSSTGDITFHLQFDSNHIQWVNDDDTPYTLVKNIDYSLSGNDVIIKKEYLQKVAPGQHKFTFCFFNYLNYMQVIIDINGLPCLNSAIAPTIAFFDKSTAGQSDVSINMTLNGNTLNEIKNGTDTLVSGTDYSVSGNTVVIKKSYLANFPIGSITLTFSFSAGSNVELVVNLSDTTPIITSINISGEGNITIPASGNISTSYSAVIKDQSETIIPDQIVFWSLENPVPGVTIGTDSGLLTVNDTALPEVIKVKASTGNISETFNVTLWRSVNSTVAPVSASFDKKASSQADISVTMTLNGNTLNSIKNDANTLVSGTDYTVSGSTVVIKKSYLYDLTLGKTTLTFHFSAGNDATIEINVLDTTPVIDINSIELIIDWKIELSWNPVNGARFYRIYYSPNPGSDTSYFKEIDSSNNSTSIFIGSFSESRLWYVNVMAYDAQMKCIGRSIEQSITGRTITGTIKLPEGCVAPSGGIPVYHYVEIPGISGRFLYTPDIIVEGCSEKEYTIYIRDSTISSCSIQYFIPNGYGYISGYYGTSELLFDGDDKPLIDINNNITEGIDVTLTPGKNIAGTVSLPYGTAPSGGLSISINTNRNFGTIYEPLIYTNQQSVTIPEGQSTADFVLTVPDIPDGSGYTLYYNTNCNYSDEHIVTYCYYSLQGTIYGNISDITLIDVRNGDVSGINFPLLIGKSVSGTVSLPEGVAPVGGMLVNIEASVVNVGTVNSFYYFLSEVVRIPEGSSSVSYSIIVPDYEKTKYKICYAVYNRIGYIGKGYYLDNNVIVLNKDQASIIDVAKEDITNINLVLLNANAYVNPLTISYDRSSTAGDVTFHLQFNSNNIQRIYDYSTHNYVEMVENIDYILSGNDVIIKKEYLQKVELGNHELTFFCFNSNYIPVMIIITGFPCLNSSITPVSASFDKKTSAQADISVTMTLNGNTLSSIKNGTSTLVSGTDYTVSGSTVVIKKSYLSGLANGNAILTFYFSAGNTAELNITITDSTPAGGGTPTGGGIPFIPFFPIGGFSGNLNSGNEPDNGVMTIAPICSDTNARVELTADNYKALLDSAAEENGIKNLTINVNDVSVDEYNAQLPFSALTGATNEANITLNTAVANITLPSNMFSETDIQGAQNIGINVAAVDRSTLPESVVQIIGKAPVVDINVIINGNVKPWNNPDAPVTISIPYTLKDGENPDNITVFYIDGAGNLVNMQGIYDPETKLVSFTTTHFSKYMVKENKVTFNDLTGFEGYAGYIESMAAKGIISGIGNNKFAPGKVLTRAEFSKLLVEMLQLDITDKSVIFSDIDTSIWYAPYVNAACKAGLIKGVGDNRFDPDNTITTQDAALILVRALKYKGITIKAGSLSGIKDDMDISSYAREAVGFTVSNGIMRVDSEGNFNAGDTVNRASAAEYIYKVFNFKVV